MNTTCTNPNEGSSNSYWIIESTNVGTIKEILSSLSDFTKNLELAASESPEKLIGIHCRAGVSNFIKVPTLKEINNRDV